ncbi:hypothetical protein BH11PSE7_BH11PSE7_26570 [soil metagenome]
MRATHLHLLAAGATCLCTGVAAQTIERIRLTDNDLSCTQIFAEVQQMDTTIQLAGTAPPPAPVAMSAAAYVPSVVPQATVPQIAVPQTYAFQGAVIADPNVQASIARARAAGMSDAQIAATLGVGMQRAGLPQMGATQAYVSPVAAGAGGLFGAIAGMTARSAAAAPPAALPITTPMMPVAQPVPRPAGIGLQAQARKEYLTGLFLSRGCKLADVQK